MESQFLILSAPTQSSCANKLSRVSYKGSVRAVPQHSMQIESRRLDTFRGWSNDAVTPEELSAAGFLYRGVEDQAQCVSCFTIISRWGPGHDPVVEHRRHAPVTCDFILNVAVGLASPTEEQRPALPGELRDVSLCKICYDRQMCVLFRPCGHLLTCKSCARMVDHCPICRGPIAEQIRAFISYQ